MAAEQTPPSPAASTEAEAATPSSAVAPQTATAEAPAQAPAPDRPVDKIVEKYGDLLFDLCEAILWSPINAQLAMRTILKRIHAARKDEAYTEYERAWVLRIAVQKLRVHAGRHGRRLSPSERIMLDATLDTDARLRQFDSYFHRLTTDDQILLLLRDKYSLEYKEIASILSIPEESLKVRRQQTLRTLEEWLWTPT